MQAPLCFFSVTACPGQLAAVVEDLKKLDAESLSYVAGIARKLAGRR